MQTLIKLVEQLGKIDSAKFASFTYKAKGTGEVAKHTVLLNFSTEEAYKKDLEAVNKIFTETDNPLTKEAAGAILSSLAVSLEGGIGKNPAYTHGADARGAGCETYKHIDGLPGVKIHMETGSLHINGMAISKEVITPGTYKQVKSAPLTIEKQKIKKELRSGKIREFVIDNLIGVRINGETLEFQSP